MGSARSEPACSHMAVVECVASVIPGSAVGEHAVPSISFGNGHLHILRVIQGTTRTHTVAILKKMISLSFLHAHLHLHTVFARLHRWKRHFLINFIK